MKVSTRSRGFTLIELVIGIVMLAVSLSIVVGIFLPQAQRFITPMYQIKASALGRSVMDQVLMRNFDDNSSSLGGVIRCGEEVLGVTVPCTTVLGIEDKEKEDNPAGFNDVDDYHVYCNKNPQTVLGYFDSGYPGYGLNICAEYTPRRFEAGADPDSKDIAKQITVTVFMPNQETITLTAFKGNY